MKKVLNLLLLFVVGFFLVSAVYAEEEIPTEGVHYFLTYPNNEVVISDDYADISKEILLYSGRTNNNGEVILNGWQESGKIRVVQKVPSEYQTDVDTISVDLSQGQTEFVDYKKTVNPHTGQSLLFLVVLATILGGTYITIRSPKKKKLMIIPIVAIAAVSLHVLAANNFTIVVKDKQGNRLNNVEVEVYGTPSTVEAAPIVIFKANGGVFLDGTDEMIMKLPHNNCNLDEFFSSFTDEDNEYFYENQDGAVRDGYYPGGFDLPDTLSDGMEINFIWEEESDDPFLKAENEYRKKNSQNPNNVEEKKSSDNKSKNNRYSNNLKYNTDNQNENYSAFTNKSKRKHLNVNILYNHFKNGINSKNEAKYTFKP